MCVCARLAPPRGSTSLVHNPSLISGSANRAQATTSNCASLTQLPNALGVSHQAHVPKTMLGSCSLSATESTTPPRREYARAGHAKKLEPIIQSLDYYDHDPEAWRSLRTSVQLMADGWTELLDQVPCDTEVYMALAAQRDRCIEALRVQSAMFQSHRQICAMALKLQETQAR